MKLNLNRLNERQREAVLHGEGPVLVLAGAGSGKTSTMAYRIAHLIAERNVPASAILGLSFTRKAAEELRERVKKMITSSAGASAARGITVTTFHSLCAQLLRRDAERIGYQKNFTILDRNDQVDVLTQILRHIKVDERKFDPDRILFEMGQAKNRFFGAEQAEAYFLESGKMPQDYAIVTASAFSKYQAQLQALNGMDFDDLLYNAVRLLETDSEVRERYNRLFRYVLVDEYQDTNPAQFRLLKLLTERQQNICVVGDDDQSIYAWRGADAKHILEFGRHYPGARVITLDQNYRSTSMILNAANGIISQNKVRHPKTLWSNRGEGERIIEAVVEDDRAEATWVAEKILQYAREAVEGQYRQIRPWKDFAVLYRSNPQSRLFEEALRMRQIPYKIVGTMSFLDRKEVKNILSYWRLLVNPKDDASARRIVNWPARGLGKTTLDVVNAYAVSNGISFLEALAAAPDLTPKARAGASAFLSLIAKMRQELMVAQLTPEGLSTWARHSLDLVGVREALADDCEDDPAKAARQWDCCEELAHGLGQLSTKELLGESPEAATGEVVLREYLARLTLDALDEEEKEDDKKKETKDEVTLLTLHGAKGLEYPFVFLVGLEEGLLPHRRVIEEATDFSEERRLCYVGVTRAKDRLFLIRAKNRIRYGKAVPRTPSRFLADIPKNLVKTQNECTSGGFDTREEQEEHEAMVKDFLAEIRAKISAPARR